MSSPVRAVVERQVRRVRRRLFGQTLLQTLLVAWAAGLLLCTLFFLLRPFTFAGLSETGRWAVVTALLGAATLTGIVVASLRAPDGVAAALALDDRFGLKERVTTLLTLTPAQIESAPGQALLDDVNSRVNALAVASRFPLTVPWSRTLLPGGALALAVAACFIDPLLAGLRFGLHDAKAEQTVNTKEIQQQLDNLRKVSQERPTDQPKSDQLKELEEAWDKLIKAPIDLNDKEKVRERVGELRKLEEKMKDRLNDLKEKTEKTDALKKQLENLAVKGDKQMKEGPAKDFQDALAKGKFAKAQEALQKLKKELDQKKLTPEKQKELAEQFKQVEEKLKRLMDDHDLAKKLQKDLKDGKIDPEQLQREMNQNFKELKELADLMGQCARGLEAGSGDEAGEKLGKLIGKLDDLKLTEDELKELINDKDLLEDALEAMLGACDGDGDGDRNGLGQGGRPGRRRPIDPNDPKSKIVNQRQKAPVNPKGQQRIAGFVRGGSFSKIPAQAVEGAFKQAVQEAPEAIERQRIPDDAADLARGYFRKLGNQRE